MQQERLVCFEGDQRSQYEAPQGCRGQEQTEISPPLNYENNIEPSIIRFS